jgi:ubiquinone/menaquinone biosynthesis C-methylase UbiE
MNQSARTDTRAEAWDQYWSGMSLAGNFDLGGVSHPAISAFWKQFFFTASCELKLPTIIDIGCGGGALMDVILQSYDLDDVEVSCVDVSKSAVESVSKRYPWVRTWVSDASDIPAESGSFDIVVSQFGLEYSGLDSVAEAARLLAEGGRLALLLHKSSSLLQLECQAGLDAIDQLRESRFIPLSGAMFRAGFNAIRGGDRLPYDKAAKDLAPAIKSLEDIMTELGKNVAGGTVFELYNGVADIHESLTRYDPGEVLGWIDSVGEEVEAFRGRLGSMLDVALDDGQFKTVCDELAARGLELTEAGPLLSPEDSAPLAWAVIAARPNN